MGNHPFSAHVCEKSLKTLKSLKFGQVERSDARDLIGLKTFTTHQVPPKFFTQEINATPKQMGIYERFSLNPPSETTYKFPVKSLSRNW